MTQKTIYTLMLALGGLMLTLPSFGTSVSFIETSLSEAPDTTFLLPFDVFSTNEGILADWEEMSQVLDLIGLNEPIIRYQLQHSPTGYDFSTIATLEPSEFSHLHRSPAIGVNFYRLKIYGSSENFIYTNIKLAEWDATLSNIFPNVVRTAASLYIASPAAEPADFIIYDTNGRMVHSEAIGLRENYTIINLDFSELHAGYYIAVVSGEQLGVEVIRFVKQ